MKDRRKYQNIFAAVTILIVLVLFYYLDDLSNWWSLRNLNDDPRPVVATIVKVENDVKFRLPESLNYYKAKEGIPLRVKDNIATEANSTARIKFKAGLEIEIQPNSLVVIEDVSSQEGSLEVTFLRGEIKVFNEAGKAVKLRGDSLKKRSVSLRTKKVGNETKLEVVTKDSPLDPSAKKDGADKMGNAEEVAAIRELGEEDFEDVGAAPIQVDLGSFERSVQKAPAKGPDINLEDKRESRKPTMIASKDMPGVKQPPKPKIQVDKETLSDRHIASVIREKKAFLNRCYAQHLRLNPDARGRMDLSLTIEPDGSVSAARVVASTIADPSLQQCVVSTVQRCRFKAFKGDPFVLRYPLNFE